MSGVPQEKKAHRTSYIFTIPESLQQFGTKSIAMCEVGVKDEKFASKRAGGDQTTLAHAMAVQSLCEVDGKPVSTGDGSAEDAFNAMHPKVRELVLQAYVHVNVAGEAATKDFLGSCQVKVA